MRTCAASFVGFLFLVFSLAAQAQSGPQFTRDHIYGPGGRVVMTAEPDTIPPSAPPNLSGYYDQQNCQTNLSWNAATDIGSGVAAYDVYRNGVLVLSTSSTSASDPVSPVHSTLYTYTVYARDAAGNVGPGSSIQITAQCIGCPPVTCGRPQPAGSAFLFRRLFVALPRIRPFVDPLAWLSRATATKTNSSMADAGGRR
jgi:hypothetical protein